MSRRNNCSNIDRNTSNIYPHTKNRVVRNNLVTPEIFVSEIWMPEGNKNGVEIVELNSNNSEVEGSPEPANDFSRQWDYVNKGTYQNDVEDCRINNLARERRRQMNEEFRTFANEYLHDNNTQPNFNGFHYIDDSEVSGQSPSQTTCFTIINNHAALSDSSSGDCPRVEEIQSDSTEKKYDRNYWDCVYTDDTITYDPINPEKRTVWIYSFKNNRHLSENDFELVNIPSKDASPISDEEYTTQSSDEIRIASPIPVSYIPRLDLSLAQTLSTVTEVSEVKASNESLVRKPINNWFTERHVPLKKGIPDVVNWMALSPRERRRRFKNTTSENENQNKEFTCAEGNILSPEEKSHKSSAIQVNVVVHAVNTPDTQAKSDADLVSVSSLEVEPQNQNTNITTTLSISYADADITGSDNEYDDLDPNIKPRIQLTPAKSVALTDPIENLDSSNWIIEEKIERQKGTVNYDLQHNESRNNSVRVDACNSVCKKFWEHNTKLMKSPLWAEYLPIAHSPSSLHLSLSLASIESKTTWLKRIGKCFNCCK